MNNVKHTFKTFNTLATSGFHQKVSIFHSNFFRLYASHLSVVDRRYSSKCGAVRVRFAPSPTGDLHLGGLRTALYNYIFAKSTNGKFILRIEDTDDKRCKPEATESLLKVLQWAGIETDEGPHCGGPVGPYVQSQRTDLYVKYSNELLEKGLAYRCFCTPTRLELLRKDRARRKLKPTYDNRCRQLSTKETETLLKNGTPYTIRLKIEPLESHEDLIHGTVGSSLDTEGDFILLKSGGQATYHLANVVDDHLMGVTHVLRGQEWLVSTAKHLLIYRYMNWSAPKFGHLPLLTNLDGSKLSKRQNSLRVESLKSEGYTPRGLANFLLSGSVLERDTKEIHSLEEIANMFDISTLGAKSAMLDMDRLNHFSRLDLLRQVEREEEGHQTAETLKQMVRSHYGEVSSLRLICPEFISSVVSKCVASPVHCLQQLVHEEMDYMWRAPPSVDKAKLDSITSKKDPSALLLSLHSHLSSLPSSHYSRECLSDVFTAVTTHHKTSLGQLMKILRTLLCNGKRGAAMGDFFATLGKEESLLRIEAASKLLKDFTDDHS